MRSVNEFVNEFVELHVMASPAIVSFYHLAVRSIVMMEKRASSRRFSNWLALNKRMLIYLQCIHRAKIRFVKRNI